MLDLILAGTIVLMLVAYGIWKVFTSGELREIVDFISMASQMDNDLFGGETREFVLNVEGVDRTIGIKTGQDLHDRVFERIESGTCILSSSEHRIEGLHLVFRFHREHGNDVLNLTERDSERVVNTTEYNLDTNPVPLINHLTDLVRRMGTSQSAEVEPMDEQTAATASAWGVVKQD
ncbi:MAG: hypothetical protein ACPHF0_03120 [Poseidonia sp.]